MAYAVHYRTHTCDDLNKDAIGQQVTLAGWVNRRRDHGGLVFLDIQWCLAWRGQRTQTYLLELSR